MTRSALSGRIVATALITTLVATSAPQTFAETPQQAGPQPAQIDRNGALALIRSSLLALDQADQTGNYTVLRDLGAPDFQQANTAARLGDIFASLRGQKLDLSGTTVLEPQLTILPQIESNGLMHMAGFFPSALLQINFQLFYAPVAGRWRIDGISVGLGSSAPVAPGAPNAPAKVAQISAKPRRKPHPVKPAPAPVPAPQ